MQRSSYYRICENLQLIRPGKPAATESRTAATESRSRCDTESHPVRHTVAPGATESRTETPIETPIEPPKTQTLKARASDDALEPCLDANSPAATFDEFISEYPKQTHHVPALRAWLALAPDRPLADQIIEHVRQRVACGAWDTSAEGREFIPNPERFITEQRWRDQFTAAADARRPRTVAERNAQVFEEWRAKQAGEAAGGITLEQ